MEEFFRLPRLEAIATSESLWNVASFALAAVAIAGDGGFDAVHNSQSFFQALSVNAFRNEMSTLATLNLGLNILFVVGKLVVRLAFVQLRGEEQRSLRKNAIEYTLMKIVFIPILVEPVVDEFIVWATWFAIMGFLKVLTMLARHRFKYLASALHFDYYAYGRESDC